MSLVGRYEILSERKERQLLQESLRRSAYSMEFANGKSPLTVKIKGPSMLKMLLCSTNFVFIAPRVEVYWEHKILCQRNNVYLCGIYGKKGRGIDSYYHLFHISRHFNMGNLKQTNFLHFASLCKIYRVFVGWTSIFPLKNYFSMIRHF